MARRRIRLAPTGRQSEVAEIGPTECRNGHRFMPGTVLISWDPHDHGGRVYSCRVCGVRETLDMPRGAVSD